MPSVLHEALVMLFRDTPRLAGTLLRSVLGIEIPERAGLTVTSAEFAELDPAEYRADLVLCLNGEDGEAEHVFIIEVQLDIDAHKRFSWPLYAAGARTRFRCPATLVVVTLEPPVARWCAQPIEMDGAGSTFRPVVIGPNAIPVITSIEQARALPELAVLSAMAHGRDEHGEAIGLAALAGCKHLDNSRASLYADLVFAHLSDIARRALERLMELNKYTYQSDFARKYYNQGVNEGYNQGVDDGGRAIGRAILRKQLQQRFGALPHEVMTRLDHADSEQLSVWAERILSAGSLAEVFSD